MKVKKIKKNINILNNQNYILWKNEREKILSKFFMEKYFYIYIPQALSFLHNLIHNSFLLFIMLFFLIIILLCIYLIFMSLFIVFNFLLILTNLFALVIFFILLKKTFGLMSIKRKKIKSLNDYFKWPAIVNIDWKMKTSDFRQRVSINIYGIIHKLFIVFSVLLMPLFFIFAVFLFIYSLIFTFILKREMWYSFIKYSPESKFVKNFKMLKKKKAENKYFMIKEI